MQRNARKLQILQILVEKPLFVEEIADAAGIDKHTALVYCLRYQVQGLVAKSDSRYMITARGLDRMVFLSN
jgi:DNA-binding IclR family transcriptional regulator